MWRHMISGGGRFYHARALASYERWPIGPAKRCISSTTPVFKGRKGGASAHINKVSSSRKKVRTKASSKRSGPKLKDGQKFGQKHTVKSAAKLKAKLSGKAAGQDGQKALPTAEELFGDMTPEKAKEYQKLAEDFLDESIGEEEVGPLQHLRKQDPDGIMNELEMSPEDSALFKQRALENFYYGTDWKKKPIEKVLPKAISEGVISPQIAADAGLLENGDTRGESMLENGNTIGENEMVPYSGQSQSLNSASDGAFTDGFAGAVGNHTELGVGSMGDLKTQLKFHKLIRVLSARGRFDEARLRIYPEMKRRGIAVDANTFSVLLNGAAIERNAEAAEELWEEMLAMGIRANEYVYASRIHALCRGRRLRKAFEIGDDMREAGLPWNVVVYTTFIAGCVQKKQHNKAWQIYKEMVINGVEPDGMTYGALMKMCADTYQYERAMKFCREMEEIDGIIPTRATIEILIRAAARAPQYLKPYGSIVDELVIKMKGLKLLPSEQTYRALFNAYGSGGDADRVLQCLEEVFELKDHDVNSIGDGVPRLAPQTYCAALSALGMCMTVGMTRGIRPRWGIMPNDIIPNLDITPIPVPREDVDYLNALKSQAMAWDEDLEAQVKQGKRQRVKFRGVYTPDDLVGDEDWELMVEEEHRRVMKKAKEAKVQKDREEKIALGIDPDRNFDHQRPCLFPDPAGKDRNFDDMPAWLKGGPDAPGLPEHTGIPPELLFGNPDMEEEYQRKKKLEELSKNAAGKALMLEDGEDSDDDFGGGSGFGREEEYTENEMKKSDKTSEKLSAQSAHNEALLNTPAFGAGGGFKLDDSAFDGEDEHVGDVARDGETSEHFGGDVPMLVVDDVEEEPDSRKEERAEDWFTTSGNNVGGMRSKKRSAKKSEEELPDSDGKEGELAPEEGRLVNGGKGLRFPPYMDNIIAQMRQTAAEGLQRKKEKHKHLVDEDEDEDESDDDDSDEDLGEEEKEKLRELFGRDVDSESDEQEPMDAKWSNELQHVPSAAGDEDTNMSDYNSEHEDASGDRLVTGSSQEGVDGEDARYARSLLEKMLRESPAEPDQDKKKTHSADANGEKSSIEDESVEDTLMRMVRQARQEEKDGRKKMPANPRGLDPVGKGSSPEQDAQRAFDEMFKEQQARGGRAGRIADSSNGGDGVFADGEGAEGEEVEWDNDDDDDPEAGEWGELKGHDLLALSDGQEEEDAEKPWVPIMHSPLQARNKVIGKTVAKLERDAMEAARQADAAVGYEGAGPAVEAVMRARLSCLKSRPVEIAEEFVDKQYPREGARFCRHAAYEMMHMYCLHGSKNAFKAVKFEERCREEFRMKPDARLLNMLVEMWSKRQNREELTKTLDLMKRLKVRCKERALKHCRMMVDKGTFSHDYLPVDPRANEKRMRKIVVNSKRPDTFATRQIVSKIMKAKHIGSMGKRF